MSTTKAQQNEADRLRAERNEAVRLLEGVAEWHSLTTPLQEDHPIVAFLASIKENQP